MPIAPIEGLRRPPIGGVVRSRTESWFRKAPIESAGVFSARARTTCGTRNTAHTTARISRTTSDTLRPLLSWLGTVPGAPGAPVDGREGKRTMSFVRRTLRLYYGPGAAASRRPRESEGEIGIPAVGALAPAG